MTAIMEYGLLVAGLVVGGAIGWLVAKQSVAGQLIRAEERLRANEASAATTEQRIRAEVENIAIKVGEENSARFIELAQAKLQAQQQEANHELDLRKVEVANLLKPLQDEMAKLTVMNTEMEKERVGAYEGIKRHLKELGEKTESLSTRTTALSTALTTSSQARGNWGEVKLRRLFEMAGMSKNIDFGEQETLTDGSRPDFVVRLPDSGVIPIDAKATGAHFLQAAELEAGSDQTALLKKHAKAMRGRIAELSQKGYQETIEGEFDHVVMFVPSEAMAAAAFSMDPDLMDYAMSKSVLIATPVTMLGLLRTVALYWQQHALAEGANEIYEVSRELYKRVNTTMDHFVKVGGHLSKAAKAYDATMSSYERRVLPQGRRLEELKVSETLQATLPEPKEIDHPKE
ncbi:MAG: DNA recombination protein RmuC [Candidatus Thermoplasmatota archaeon]|nr:DNA recombination protein RmuC [Candidatus Thermoplasmatota archaeon]